MNPGYQHKPSDEQLYQWIVVERRKLSDIAHQLGVQHSTISNWKAKLGIPKGIIVPFTKQDIERWYMGEGLTESEIAEKTGVEQSTVGRYRRMWGIEVLQSDDRRALLNPINLTELQQDIVIGTMLDDAHIRPHKTKGSGKNSIWVCEHGDKQREYLAHLSQELKPYVEREPYRYWRLDTRMKGGGCWTNGNYSLAHLYWTRLRDVWYPQGKKIIPISELEKLTIRALAYWYADDGSKAGMSSNLYTLDFSKEDVLRAKQFLSEKFNLSSELKEFDHRNQFYLHFDRDQTQKLMHQIRPHLEQIPGVQYKIVSGARVIVQANL